MRIDVPFAGQVPKDPAFCDANEDAFELAPDTGRIAISDGASESFDSRTWARLLVAHLVRDPVGEASGELTAAPSLCARWLDAVMADYRSRFEPNEMSWSKRASFDRGSFATLLGVAVIPMDDALEIVSVGDSLAILLDGGDLVASFPYSTAVEFQQRPELLSTHAGLNGFVSNGDFAARHTVVWRVDGLVAPVVLCVTDAIGEWALRCAEEGMPVWNALCAIRDVVELETLVLGERAERRMRVDDATLVRLSVTVGDTHELPVA